MQKYFLYLETSVLAIKYIDQEEVLHVGGYTGNRLDIDSVCQHYFNVDIFNKRIVTERYVQKNKVRLIFKCSRKKFTEGIEKLKDQGFVLSQVKSLGRLMR